MTFTRARATFESLISSLLAIASMRLATKILPISLQFEHCVLRELVHTSLLIRDGVRKENAANLHRQVATH